MNTATINYCTGIISQLLTSSQQNLTVSCPQQWSQRASGYSVQQRGDVATAHRWGLGSAGFGPRHRTPFNSVAASCLGARLQGPAMASPAGRPHWRGAAPGRRRLRSHRRCVPPSYHLACIWRPSLPCVAKCGNHTCDAMAAIPAARRSIATGARAGPACLELEVVPGKDHAYAAMRRETTRRLDKAS